MAIRKELLEILACPKCKGDIYLTEQKTASSVTAANCCMKSGTISPLC